MFHGGKDELLAKEIRENGIAKKAQCHNIGDSDPSTFAPLL